jgi:hypothetical protein
MRVRSTRLLTPVSTVGHHEDGAVPFRVQRRVATERHARHPAPLVMCAAHPSSAGLTGQTHAAPTATQSHRPSTAYTGDCQIENKRTTSGRRYVCKPAVCGGP